MEKWIVTTDTDMDKGIGYYDDYEKAREHYDYYVKMGIDDVCIAEVFKRSTRNI